MRAAIAVLLMAATLTGVAGSQDGAVNGGSTPPQAASASAATVGGCAAPHPMTGMLCLESNIHWTKGEIPATEGQPAAVYYRGEAWATDNRVVTIIAGSLAPDDSGGAEEHGVKASTHAASAKYKRGVVIRHCKLDEPPREEVQLVRGFMHVRVAPAEGTPKSATWSPWPLIVRTPLLPGGAFAGVFVVEAVVDDAGKHARETFFRPSQESKTCEGFAAPDARKDIYVLASPGGDLVALDQVGFAEVSPANSGKGKLKADDERFLIDACRFVKRVDDHKRAGEKLHRWPCEGEDKQAKAPPASGKADG